MEAGLLRHVFRTLLVTTFVAAVSAAQPPSPATTGSARAVDLTLGSGEVLRVEPVAANIIRVRLSPDREFAPSLMERYGIVRTDWPACEFSSRQEADGWLVSTQGGSLRVHAGDGRMELLGGKGQTICESIVPQRR